MSSHHKLDPPAYEFHPEFGYLCPSRKVRKYVRAGLATAAFGLIAGVIGVMALFPRHGGNLPGTGRALSVAPAAVGDSAPPTASPPGMAGRVVSVDPVAKRPPAAAPTGRVGAPKAISAESPAPADKPCTEETWPYFDSKCLWGPPRKNANLATPVVHTPARAAPAVTANRGAVKRSEQRPAASKKTRTANSSKHRRAGEPNARAAFATSPFGFQASPLADVTRSGRRRDWGGWW